MGMPSSMATYSAQAWIGEAVTPFNNANARLGVGDSTAAFSSGQSDLQGTNTLRKGMDATFPQRSGAQLAFKATFGGPDANFAWNEWAVFNAASGGQMLNRKVESLGTKAAGATWVFTGTITPSVS